MDAKLTERRFELDDGLLLRHLVNGDADALCSAVMVNYDHLRTFLHWVAPTFSQRTALDFIQRSKRSIKEGKVQNWGVFLDGNLAGMIGFVRFDHPSRNCEIGYWISKEHEGRGLITRSCRRLLDYAFHDLKFNRVEIHCAAENVRSRRIPERLGFTLEGVLRRSQWRHDRFHDMAIYGLLAEEWPSSSDL